MINRGADMVAHGGDFHIVPTVGAFDRGQKARCHRRHPGFGHCSAKGLGAPWHGNFPLHGRGKLCMDPASLWPEAERMAAPAQ